MARKGLKKAGITISPPLSKRTILQRIFPSHWCPPTLNVVSIRRAPMRVEKKKKKEERGGESYM
jgi:hypothetical protein